MGALFDTMVTFFREDDWKYEQLPDKTILRMGVTGKNGKWTCFAQAREEQEQFVFYSVCAANASEEKRPAVAEFLSRANYGMVIGNFEMDYKDGEIRYKTSIDVEGDRLSAALIRSCVHININMMDHYLPGLMSLMYGSLTPSQAIAQMEG